MDNRDILTSNINHILNNEVEKVTFEPAYKAAYYLTRKHERKDTVPDLTNYIHNLVSNRKLSDHQVKCINDLLLYYTYVTGDKIKN